MNGTPSPSSGPALSPPVAGRSTHHALPPSPADSPIPPVDHRHRRDRLRSRLAEQGLTALHVSDLRNVRWLTGFTGSNGQVLVTSEAELDTIFTDARYSTQVGTEAAHVQAVIVRAGVTARVVERLVTAGLDTVGFEADRLSWEAGEGLRRLAHEAGIVARPAAGHVEALRAVKDDHELSAIRTACEITATAFAEVVRTLRPGTSERGVATSVDRMLIDLGAEAPAFETIVAAGPNSARPHHRPSGRELCRGDLVQFDFGARFAGYHADMSRTVAFGDTGDELRAVHELVRSAQAAGVAATVAGATAGDVDRACRDLIAASGRGEKFLHPTGHGLGLAIHERPTLAHGGRATLEAGMTVTVEPGVYLAGVGGVRIEDTVVVTEAGPPEILTRAPYDLVIP